MGKAILADKEKKQRDLLGRVEKNSREKFNLQEKYLKYQDERQKGEGNKSEENFKKELYKASQKGVTLTDEEKGLPLAEKEQILMNKLAEKSIEKTSTSKNVKAPTLQELNTITDATIIKQRIGDLRKILNEGGKGQFAASLPFGGFSESGQELKSIIEDVGERILRLKSGAAVTPSEYERFIGMLPKFLRMDKVDLNQLDRLEEEFTFKLDELNKKYGRTDSNTSESDKKYQEYLQLIGRA